MTRNDECPAAATHRLLLTAAETSKELAISPRSLWSLTSPRGAIPAVRIGRSVRYDPADLGAWIQAQKEGGDDR
jgi:predicted DNA-binding transcriptional regulator AlpA